MSEPWILPGQTRKLAVSGSLNITFMIDGAHGVTPFVTNDIQHFRSIDAFAEQRQESLLTKARVVLAVVASDDPQQPWLLFGRADTPLIPPGSEVVGWNIALLLARLAVSDDGLLVSHTSSGLILSNGESMKLQEEVKELPTGNPLDVLKQLRELLGNPPVLLVLQGERSYEPEGYGVVYIASSGNGGGGGSKVPCPPECIGVNPPPPACALCGPS